MNILNILQGVDQILLLVTSAVFAILSLSFVADIVTGYWKKKMSHSEAFVYGVLAFGVGRVAAEGLLSAWHYRAPLIWYFFT